MEPTTGSPVRTQAADDKLKQVSTYLAAGFGVVTAVLGFIGVSTGALERILRNQPAEAQVWFLLIGVGIACGVIAAVISEGKVGGGGLALILLGEGLCLVALIWIRSPTLVTLRAADSWSTTPSVSVGLVLLAVVGLAAYHGVPRQRRTRWHWPRTVVVAGLIAALVALAATRAEHLDLHVRQVLIVAGALALALGVVRSLGTLRLSFRELIVLTGFVAFFIGLGGMVQLGARSKATKDRPRVTATLNQTDTGLILEAGVNASGLTNDEHVLVLVEGLSSTEDLDGLRIGLNHAPSPKLPTYDYAQELQLHRVGPDEDGKIDVPIKVNVPPGLYERVRVTAYITPSSALEQLRRELDRAERRAAATNATDADRQRAGEKRSEYSEEANRRCSEVLQDRACVSLLVPQSIGRPNVSAKWASGVNQVDVEVNGSEMSAEDVVMVALWDPSGPSPLYQASLAPGAGGRVASTASVPIPAASTEVCVAVKRLRAPRVPASPFNGEGTAASRPPEKEAIVTSGACPVNDFSLVAVRLTRTQATPA